MKHVERALPDARHVELECGHVPQAGAKFCIECGAGLNQ